MVFHFSCQQQGSVVDIHGTDLRNTLCPTHMDTAVRKPLAAAHQEEPYMYTQTAQMQHAEVVVIRRVKSSHETSTIKHADVICIMETSTVAVPSTQLAISNTTESSR